AHHVGDTGKVYAVDESSDMIRHINRRIRELKVTKVVSILADPDDPLLPEGSVNRFFFSDSWYHIDNQTQYLSLMKQMLKPEGEIIIIDFHKKELPVGPPTGNENRPRGSDQADGEERIWPYERPHLLTRSVFPGLCLKVGQDGILYSAQLPGTRKSPSGSTEIPPCGD